MFPRPSLPAGFELSPRPSLPAGDGAVYAAESACGQGLRTGAHLRCFPSHRCAAGPSPFTKPRAATPSEVPAHPAFPGRGTMLQPLGCRDCLRFDLLAASIRKSGLEIGNRCRDCPCFGLFAASIRKFGLEIKNRCTISPKNGPAAAAIANSGPEIGNHCSAIVPASRMARLRKVVAATMTRPIPIFVAAK